MIDVELRGACRLLGVYTANRFDVWALAGPARASCRAHIASVLLGRKVPQAKAGVTMLRDELFTRSGVTGNCLAAREEAFIRLCLEWFGKTLEQSGGAMRL